MFAPARSQSEVVNIHATCVAAGNGGVLILGQSGQGKSDLALRLIDRGARLVADDRCDIWSERGRLWCRPPEALAGKLEIRGIGIVEKPWTAPVPLALAVRLTDRYDRMPAVGQVETIAGHALPALLLSAFEVSAPIKIMIALERLAPAA
ncbi:MAG: serine kinase [Sphingopyxis sp.]|uniref:HPr kinase/phosphorylase n=1 Tax=Sphingopyxis sp. TaxID=1908224 RepID=UPI002ABA8356|nr:serine kinase [Sphingopyxis sp.]MDZ3830675.1 serine kinase [Sphingopyxis sp.]